MLQPRRITVEENATRAFGNEPFGDGEAEAAGAAGDQGDLPFESPHRPHPIVAQKKMLRLLVSSVAWSRWIVRRAIR